MFVAEFRVATKDGSQFGILVESNGNDDSFLQDRVVGSNVVKGFGACNKEDLLCGGWQ